MARPLKEGLDYFPLDVDIDQDDKVIMVEAQFPQDGFKVIIKLLMRIYSNGYYSKWTKREQLIFSTKINVNINSLTDIVNACIEEGLFNKRMYEEHEILTSQGIQERYLEAVKRRKQTSFIEKYFLIDDVMSIIGKNLIDVFIVNDDGNKVNVNINSDSKGVNDNKSTQRKGNRKEKKTEDNNIKDKPAKIAFAEYVNMQQKEYDKLVKEHGKESTDEMIKVLDNYKGSSGKKYKDDYRAILSWVADKVTGKQKQPANPKDIDFTNL
jgi:hypothetical protein